LGPKPKGAALHAVLEERETSGSLLGSFHGRRPSRQAAVHPGQHLWLAFIVQHGREEHLARILSKYAYGQTRTSSTTGPPVYTQARRLDTAKLTSTKAEFKNMEQLGIIRRSNSP